MLELSFGKGDADPDGAFPGRKGDAPAPAPAWLEPAQHLCEAFPLSADVGPGHCWS